MLLEKESPLALYNYDEMVQDALRQVVKKAIETVVNHGLVGNHHFYISFRTDHADVVLPKYLKEAHPEEITIVLQYQFWGLNVEEHGFEVTLSFNEVHERLYVPFNALTSFVDPSVKFGLQFVPIMTSSLTAGEKESKKQALSGVETPETAEKTEGNIIRLDTFRKK